ncbi:MAG: multicopper oxidase domain-containing protein [Microcoleaceae cyanobacterium]
MADVVLRDAYIIGQENFEAWSEGFDPEGYLKVLPHPDVVVPFYNPIEEWQNNPEGNTGDFFSSWGPDEVLEAELSMEEIDELEIPGLGVLSSGNGLVEWLPRLDADDGLPVLDENGETLPSFTPYELLRVYQGTAPDGTISDPMIPGPLIVAEPGDRVELTLTNNLTKIEEAGNTPANVLSNLHTHGYHTSPLGRGDNVLHLLDSGETFDYDIQVPADQTVGMNWYHPHFHGYTNTQLAAGLVGVLQVNPRHDEPDLDKWDPTSENFYLMTLNTFGIQQVDRPGSPDDPLNQNPDISLPAGTPIQTEGFTDEGLPIYELSDAVFIGYNAKPVLYDPELPLGRNEDGTNNPDLFEYGGGVLEAPAENVIHTINGQYNPTLELETGELQTFSLLNSDVNSHHVLQLYKEEVGPDGEVTLELHDMTYVGLDGDSFPGRATDEVRRTMEDSPIFQPGQRITIDHSFTEPGKYYLLSNGTPEIVGENSPELIQTMTNKLAEGQGAQGFDDGHYTWGPQVLMTFDVTGPETTPTPIPEAYDSLEERIEALIERVNAAENGVGVDRERTYIWSANIGGAIAEGNIPDDLDVETFEGTYRINGGYFAGDAETPLSLPMLGTTEIWNVYNISGLSDDSLPVDIPLLEWHPFHIHQNPFTVLDINGQRLADIDNSYLPYIEGDTIALPPTHDPGTVSEDNPYGTAEFGAEASIVRMYMQFKDYAGSFVNHCHILFHEDAGMMAVVRVILNTEDTWLGLGNEEGDSDGTAIELSKGSSLGERVSIKPFGEDYTGAVDVAIADVNFKLDFEGFNVNDNVTDVVAIQTEEDYTVKVFDGQTLFNQQAAGETEFDGDDDSLLIQEFTPFADANISPGQEASVASGDVNGDGFAEIVVGVGGESPLIEIYSGENFELLASITPFTEHEDFDSKINLAVGDASGDNFDDIYVTGGGSLEIFSGIEIDKLLVAGEEVDASEVALLSEHVHPYGHDYTGEIEITSGYALQRPEPEDNSVPTADFDLTSDAVQTNAANITTLAVDKELLSEGQEQVKILTYTAAGHHAGHGGEEEHEGEHEGEHEHMEIDSDELRIDAEFTPDAELEEISGTFADIPTQDRGEPVIFGRTADGDSEMIHLQAGNVAVENRAGTDGDDKIQGGNDGDFMFGYQGDDTINGFDGADTVLGGPGNDLIRGNDGNDSIRGNPGFDIIIGGDGNDTINGGNGRDRINGGPGNDRLIGGASKDKFIFNTNDPFVADELGVDTIVDFQLDLDTILLDSNTFTEVDNIETDFESVDTDDAAATSDAFIVYSLESGNLYYNPNGTDAGFGDGARFARLAGAPELEADNFLLR